MEPVRKDCQNPQTRSRYASFYALDQALRPVYTAHGLGVSFDTALIPDRPDELMVLAYVTLGAYIKVYQIPMPCDGIGAKGGMVMTKTHARGSAFTYGRRYLLSGIFNVATADSDDDGNAATTARRPPTPAPNPMEPPQDNRQYSSKPKGGAVTTDEYKKLDHMLSEAAERGTLILKTAWQNLTPFEQKAMKAALDRRYKPRAQDIDARGVADADETQDDTPDEAPPF
jgi:hypothetical protein